MYKKNTYKWACWLVRRHSAHTRRLCARGSLTARVKVLPRGWQWWTGSVTSLSDTRYRSLADFPQWQSSSTSAHCCCW